MIGARDESLSKILFPCSRLLALAALLAEVAFPSLVGSWVDVVFLAWVGKTLSLI